MSNDDTVSNNPSEGSDEPIVIGAYGTFVAGQHIGKLVVQVGSSGAPLLVDDAYRFAAHCFQQAAGAQYDADLFAFMVLRNQDVLRTTVLITEFAAFRMQRRQREAQIAAVQAGLGLNKRHPNE